MSGGALARPNVAVTDDQVVRYTLLERVNHWINAISYSYLLATGLALFTPHLYWLAAVLGGGPTVRFWHPWMGLVYMASLLWMNSAWKRDMVTTAEDLEWQKHLKDYMENRDEKVQTQHRYKARQKQ